MTRPNLVFLFPDQLRARALSVYNPDGALGPVVPTPHIEALAAQSLDVRQMVSTCPVCTPYRAMMLTGRHAQTTGHVINSTTTRHDEISLGDAFARAGYKTGWCGKWHLHRGAWPAEHVPDWVPEGRDRLGFDYWRAYNQHMQYHDGWVHKEDWRVERYETYETEQLNRYGFEFIDACQDAGDPFCLFLSPQPPHWGRPPGQMAPARYYDRLPDDAALLAMLPANVPDEPRFRGDAIADLRQYLAMILAVDDMVGELVAGLKARGVYDDTLLIFTSDHGTQGGAHGVTFWTKKRPHEESLHVPMLARLPGVLPVGTCEALTTQVDLFPTLCALCGVEPPA